MPQSANYDVIVIGTSQGGRFLPATFAKADRKVAVIERGHLGGVCVNAGCIPTKTMVASARVAYLAKRGAEYGVRTGPISIDLACRTRTQTSHGRGCSQQFREQYQTTAGPGPAEG